RRAVLEDLEVRRLHERPLVVLPPVAGPRLGDRERLRVVERDVDRAVPALRVPGDGAEAPAVQRREAPIDALDHLEHEALVVAVRRVRPLRVAAEGAVVTVRHHQQVGADRVAVELGVERHARGRVVDERPRPAGASVEEVEHREAHTARRRGEIPRRRVDVEGPRLAERGRVELLVVEMAWRDAYRIDRRRKPAVAVVGPAVGEGAVDPHRQPYENHRGHEAGHRALRAAGGALGWLLALLAVAGGVGWLYLIRDVHLLAHGPSVSGALPLEE